VYGILEKKSIPKEGRKELRRLRHIKKLQPHSWEWSRSHAITPVSGYGPYVFAPHTRYGRSSLVISRIYEKPFAESPLSIYRQGISNCLHQNYEVLMCFKVIGVYPMNYWVIPGLCSSENGCRKTEKTFCSTCADWESVFLVDSVGVRTIETEKSS